MISPAAIQAYADQIAEAFAPERIVLFGSYAYGTPTEDSDVDLMVLVSRKARAELNLAIQEALRPPFRLDLLVRTTEEFERRSAMGDFFLMDIREKGEILYEAPDCGVGRESRGGLRGRPARASRAKVA